MQSHSERTTQCEAILHRLQLGPATSWQLQQLGICCHTKRISELRRSGYQIEKSEQRRSLKRIVTYRLVIIDGNGDAPVSVLERTPLVLNCTWCGQYAFRKSKARELRPGEKSFCCDAHRAAFHRRKESPE